MRKFIGIETQLKRESQIPQSYWDEVDSIFEDVAKQMNDILFPNSEKGKEVKKSRDYETYIVCEKCNYGYWDSQDHVCYEYRPYVPKGKKEKENKNASKNHSSSG